MGTRIGIIGVGAIGSIVGGLLTKAGHGRHADRPVARTTSRP